MRALKAKLKRMYFPVKLAYGPMIVKVVFLFFSYKQEYVYTGESGKRLLYTGQSGKIPVLI